MKKEVIEKLTNASSKPYEGDLNVMEIIHEVLRGEFKDEIPEDFKNKVRALANNISRFEDAFWEEIAKAKEKLK